MRPLIRSFFLSFFAVFCSILFSGLFSGNLHSKRIELSLNGFYPSELRHYEFLGPKKEVYQLLIRVDEIGEPAAMPLELTATLVHLQSKLRREIVVERKICDVHRPYYLKKENSLYLRMVKIGESGSCDKKFSTVYKLPF